MAAQSMYCLRQPRRGRHGHGVAWNYHHGTNIEQGRRRRRTTSHVQGRRRRRPRSSCDGDQRCRGRTTSSGRTGQSPVKGTTSHLTWKVAAEEALVEHRWRSEAKRFNITLSGLGRRDTWPRLHRPPAAPEDSNFGYFDRNRTTSSGRTSVDSRRRHNITMWQAR